MSRPQVMTIDVPTGETIVREMNDEELAVYLKNQEEIAQREAAALSEQVN